MNIEDSIKKLKEFNKIKINSYAMQFVNISYPDLQEAIETLLTAYEKEKEEHKKECNNCDEYTAKLGKLEVENEMLKLELEKEKEKNKGAEEKIKKYINKIQKELDKYKIKNTNTYIQIEGNPEINGLLIQKATLEELIKGGIKQC